MEEIRALGRLVASSTYLRREPSSQNGAPRLRGAPFIKRHGYAAARSENFA